MSAESVCYLGLLWEDGRWRQALRPANQNYAAEETRDIASKKVEAMTTQECAHSQGAMGSRCVCVCVCDN